MLPPTSDKKVLRLNMALLPFVTQPCGVGTPGKHCGRIERFPGSAGCWRDFASRRGAAATRIEATVVLMCIGGRNPKGEDQDLQLQSDNTVLTDPG
jgi:hypothetical protein